MGKQLKDPNKIGFGEKMAFLMGGSAIYPINMMMNTYLLIFYTDVVGLSMGAVATMMLLAKIFDAVNDPMMGFLIDHFPRTKKGRYLGYLLIGTVICGINFFFLWWAPFAVSNSMKLAVAYITYFLMGVTFDLAAVPANAMLVVESPKPEDRVILSTWKTVGQYVGVGVSLAVPFILELFDTAIQGYIWSAAGMIAFAVIAAWIGQTGMKERVVISEEETKYSLKELFQAVTFRPVFIIMLALLLNSIPANFSLNTYYFTYVIDDLTLVTWTNIPAAIGMLLGVFFSAPLANRFGRKKLYVFSCLIYCVACPLRFINPTSVPIIMFICFVQGWLGGAGVVVLYAIQADTIDIMEYQKGIRAEGAVLSINGLVTKMGGALGSTIPAYILAWCGYQEAIDGAAQTQSDFVVTMIVVLTVAVPMVFFCLSALIYGAGYRYSDKQMHEITKALEEKHAGEGMVK